MNMTLHFRINRNGNYSMKYFFATESTEFAEKILTLFTSVSSVLSSEYSERVV